MIYKLVCDTNVLAAGSLFPDGPSGFILKQWEEEKIVIVMTPAILDELQRVLIENFSVAEQDAEYTRKLFAYKSVYINETKNIDEIKEDPTDNKFLEAAVAGNASFIISWDKHLLKLKNYQNILIIDPPKFCRLLRKQ